MLDSSIRRCLPDVEGTGGFTCGLSLLVRVPASSSEYSDTCCCS
jgi:hypothetical protein